MVIITELTVRSNPARSALALVAVDEILTVATITTGAAFTLIDIWKRQTKNIIVFFTKKKMKAKYDV